MPVNPHFNNYNFASEQKLIDDLVVESIKIYGVDMYYITRCLENVDEIFNEATHTYFDGAYIVEMYVKDSNGFRGMGDFMEKFGLEMQDQITFTVAITSFNKYVKAERPKIIRPNEGDVVFFPITGEMYDIKHVEHESVFYQTGKLQVYDLKCELLEYSNQKFMTGIEMIDKYNDKIDFSNVNSLEELAEKNVNAKNLFFDENKDELIDETVFDPFKEIITYPETYK